MKIRKNNKGSAIIELLLILPLLIFLILFFVFLIVFGYDSHKFNRICDNYFEKALVEGQFTNTLKDDFINELDDGGFNKDLVEITSPQSEVLDSDDDTYVVRGNSIDVKIKYNKEYKINMYTLGIKKILITKRCQGMSEELR
ncbi:MAG: DUF4320 family protein [Tissierellales bacterium]|nr:DUF4320 family protein [Tissierellales bacterium]